MTADRLESDLAEALRAGETERVGVLRLVKTALKNEVIKTRQPLNEDEVIRVIGRQAKQRRDSIAAYTEAGRQDLAKVEEGELAIIKEYLPEALSEAELTQLVDQVMTETGATEMSQAGTVIGAVMARAAGKADGAAVAAAVRQHLS